VIRRNSKSALVWRIVICVVSRSGLLSAIAPAAQGISRPDGATATRSQRQRAASFGAVYIRRPAVSRRSSAWSQSTPSTQLKGILLFYHVSAPGRFSGTDIILVHIILVFSYTF